jgi:hypothetical protein
LRTGAWLGPGTKKYFQKTRSGKFRACERKPAVTRKKEAVSRSCSEQDDKRFRSHLVRPRAGAHMWGRGARILTEINRLPQSDPVSQAKFPLNLWLSLRPLQIGLGHRLFQPFQVLLIRRDKRLN